MRSILYHTKHFIKNNKWWSALIAIVLLIVIYFVFVKKPASTIGSTVTVESRNITEEVSATGNVKPLSDISMAFETGGKVSDIAVSIGDKVSAGQYLASVSNSDLSAAVDQAKASLSAAEADLAILKNGSTPQQIAVSQSQEQEALGNFNQAKSALINSIQDAYTKSDDAVRNKADSMFDNPRSSTPKLSFDTTNSQLSINVDLERENIENTLLDWNNSSVNLTPDSDLQSAADIANQNLDLIKNFLNDVNLSLNSAVISSSVTEDVISSWQASIATARTNIALAISNMSSASTQYNSMESLLKVAEDQLTLTKAPATDNQIKAQQALVDQAAANVENAKAKLEKTIIRSPIDGTISRVDTDVGETVQSGVNVISVISYGEYEVEAFIPEADIAKVKIGDVATTTLDAYGSDTFFQMTVIKIDPAETVIEGVPTYKVTLKFASDDSRIKSGMTANLDILTGQKYGVLAVPARSVYSVDTQKYAQLVDSENKIADVPVQTGMRGVDGYIEIISGLKEGDTIVGSPNI